MIRTAIASDAKSIAAIYNHYILNTRITFEENPVDEQTMRRRILTHPKLPWFVFEENNTIVGYCYSVPWKP
jgi:phosphinothricin acetyltransferase